MEKNCPPPLWCPSVNQKERESGVCVWRGVDWWRERVESGRAAAAGLKTKNTETRLLLFFSFSSLPLLILLFCCFPLRERENGSVRAARSL